MVVFSPRIDGAGFGLGIMCYSNAVRRLRMFRRARTPRPTAKWGAQKNGIVCGKMCRPGSSAGRDMEGLRGETGEGRGEVFGPIRASAVHLARLASQLWDMEGLRGETGKGGGMSFVPPVPRCCTWQGLEPVLGARSVRAASLTFAAHRAQDRGSTRARC